jgi:predicted metal-dependent phosphoesterase TrpH
MVADLHLHSRCSDGALAPADLVRLVASRGVRTFSITDHDTMDAYAEASHLATQLGLRLIPGVEVSTRFGRHDLHILVYGLEADEPVWISRLRQQKSIRYRRAKEIVTALHASGASLTIEDVIAEAGHLNLGRHHIARVLVQAGYASGIQAAFDRWVLPASATVTERFPDSLDLISEVRSLGGVPILAHPGATFPYPDIKVLVDGGLSGIEAAHPRHDERVKRKWTDYARRIGILATGGSDYHGHRTGEETNIGRFLGQHIPESEVACH